MQAMLAAFLQTNTKNTAIQSVQADWIGRTYPLLFTINLPKEEDQFKRMMYRLKPFVVYLNGLESIDRILTLQVYLEL